MRNRVIHRNSPFRLLAAALAVLTLTLLAVMVPCEGEAHAAAPIKVACVGDSLTDGSKSSGGKKGDTAYPAWLGRILGSHNSLAHLGLRHSDAEGQPELLAIFAQLLCAHLIEREAVVLGLAGRDFGLSLGRAVHVLGLGYRRRGGRIDILSHANRYEPFLLLRGQGKWLLLVFGTTMPVFGLGTCP